ncbi:MAG: radical SAM protein [Saprospiraceae bacterium]|nr:radical SAM protein [Saprospiraceae bacterium]
MKKVLFTTVFNKPNVVTDMVAEHVKTFPRAGATVRVSPGLRFLKQNIPELEVLEYPEYEDYVEKLKEGWDIVGFSVYLYQIPEILEMIEIARAHGVKEIWAGNYGAPVPAIEEAVDRVVIGDGFDEVSALFGYSIAPDKIEHPAMTATVTAIWKFRLMSFGILYTAFGCPFHCSFCQTPVFIKNRRRVNLESIDRVLKHYHELGIRYIGIFDETFGVHAQHYEGVTKLLEKYGMIWAAQSRVEIFLKHYEKWYERGLRLPGIGVEFMDEGILKDVNKTQAVDKIKEWAKVSRKPGMFRYAFSIIGHPDMDREKTIADAYKLKALGFEINRASVLTPFPHTQQWDEIDSKYGIDEPDMHKYDSRNLVWKHPYIGKEEMLELLHELKTTFQSSIKLYKDGLGRLFYDELKRGKWWFFKNYVVRGIVRSNFINDKEQYYFPNMEGHRRSLDPSLSEEILSA